MQVMGLVQIGWTLVFQIVNTIIIFLVLKKLLFKPVSGFMEKRTQSIENAIIEADEKNKEAKQLKADYEKKLEEIKHERIQIIKEETARAKEKGEEIVRAALEEAKKISERATQNIEAEKQKAINELKDQISELAILAASKIIEKEINAKTHENLIKEFIEEVGEVQWQN